MLPGTVVGSVFAFSFSYESNLTGGSAGVGAYSIPGFVDGSPIVLVVQGTCGSVGFN